MIIANARINTVEKGTIENGFVQFDFGKILQIGSMNELDDRGEEFLDAKGCLLLPGFIDAHCHIGLWEDSLKVEGEDGNEATVPQTPHLRAIDAINVKDKCFEEARAFGITTVVVSPGSANPVGGQVACLKTFGKTLDDSLISDNVGTKFALGENPKMCYRAREEMPSTRMGTAAMIREQLTKARVYLENKKNNSDFKFNFRNESLVPLLERKTKAYFHAHRSDDICTAIRIAKEFNLDYVLVHCTDGIDILEKLKNEGAKVIAGPILCDRSKPELRELTPRLLGALSGGGIKTALCTDHPVVPIQYLTLCAALAINNGQTPEHALRSITTGAAEICGIDDRVGSIGIGKDADILLFEKDPLVNVFERPKHVFINGIKVV